MPAQYEAIRDALVRQGRPYGTAQRIAAATYNSQHPDAPMSPAHPEGLKKRIEREETVRQLGQ